MGRPTPRGTGLLRAGAAFALLAAAFVPSAGCERLLKRRPVDSLEVLPYPTCSGAAASDIVLAERTLRAGPLHPTPELVETYRFVARGCHRVMTVRQQWSRQVDEVEVVYDATYAPLRAWKRMTVPAVSGQSPHVETRRYELRTMPVGMTVAARGSLQHYVFKRRERPIGVVGPGRGLLAALVARAKLTAPGRQLRGPMVDIRESVERLEPITFRREAGRAEPGMGAVDLYTIYGRETVMVQGMEVVGDLLGLRPAHLVPTPMPALIPTGEPPDPVHTP